MKWYRNLRMAYKIVLPVALVLTIILVTIVSIAADRSSQAIRHIAQLELEALAGKESLHVQNFFEKSLAPLQSLSAGMSSVQTTGAPMDRDKVVAMLKGMLRNNESALGIYTGWEPDAYDGNDAVYAGTPGHDATGRFTPNVNRAGGSITVDSLGNPDGEDYYSTPRKTRKAYITAPYDWDFSGTVHSLVSLCIPILVNGEFVGIVGTDFDLGTLKEEILSIRVHETGNAFLLTGDGQFVVHQNEDLVGKKLFSLAGWKERRDVRGAMQHGKAITFEQMSTQDDRVAVYSFMPIHFDGTDTTWYLAIKAPVEEILADSTALTRFLIILCVIATLVTLGAILLISRQLSRPVELMVEYAKEIASGNYQAKSDASLFGGELRTLHSTFGEMVASLVENIARSEQLAAEAQEQTVKAREALEEAERLQKDAQVKNESMLSAALQLEDVVHVVSTASEQLAAQVEQASRGAEAQTNRVAEVATAMEQMNASVLEVAQSAATASETAESTKQKALQGASMVSDVVSQISRVQQSAMAIKEDMSLLGAKVDGIGQVMVVITDIADQTNLLALNAAIEAARAGEAGRGFAVVADEVRKLAEKTMSATTQVGAAIKGIQEGTRQNIHNVDEAVTIIETTTGLVNQSGESLKEIVAFSESNTTQVVSIATASEEQSAASEEITDSIGGINRISMETSSSMQQSATAVVELAEQARVLGELVLRMKEQGER